MARAKELESVTVAYALATGGLLWVGYGNPAESLCLFLAELSQDTAASIEAVAMVMGVASQAAARDPLPNATIVLDRLWDMKLYCDKAVQDFLAQVIQLA